MTGPSRRFTGINDLPDEIDDAGYSGASHDRIHQNGRDFAAYHNNLPKHMLNRTGVNNGAAKKSLGAQHLYELLEMEISRH